jgi:hypothetical protein
LSKIKQNIAIDNHILEVQVFAHRRTEHIVSEESASHSRLKVYLFMFSGIDKADFRTLKIQFAEILREKERQCEIAPQILLPNQNLCLYQTSEPEEKANERRKKAIQYKQTSEENFFDHLPTH